MAVSKPLVWKSNGGSLIDIHMIQLIKLNGQSFLLNASLIEQVEAFPDTTITLVNGKKVFVKNTVEEVQAKANTFFQSIGWTGLLHDDEEDS